MNDLFGLTPTDLGISGLLALVVLLVLTGRLVPRSTLQDMRDERDKWQAAHDKSEAARQAERDQVTELLELSRVAGHVLSALPRPKEVEGGVDVVETSDR
ncbi:hypothetical protein [Streptomyces sp. WAC08241]|uniref:hypothetical protein n=1 Tax=Streptomyces sp. WAC08241 TaxID=2487421 RepID=UPI000F79AA0A|nr:hypothetical protein [Streptomyces sp. WAC08241]RSS43836.1 hypothetical protein EF906_08800 [Streptomyces sp. WAC08241]